MNLITMLKYVFLGFIQGFTEPIPVSSSGHLFIFKSLLNDNVLNDLKNNGTAILYLAESLDLSNIADSLYILKDGSIICDNTLELKSYKYINGYTTDIKKLNEFEVLNLEVINNNVSFIYKGNVEKILHNMNLNNITISQPHIMDIEGLYEQNTIQE